MVKPTVRLRVEPLRVEDADDMVEVLSDARLYEFTGGSPPDVEVAWVIGRAWQGQGYATGTVVGDEDEGEWRAP